MLFKNSATVVIDLFAGISYSGRCTIWNSWAIAPAVLQTESVKRSLHFGNIFCKGHSEMC